MHSILKSITALLPLLSLLVAIFVVQAQTMEIAEDTAGSTPSLNGSIEPLPVVENEEIDPLSKLNPILIPVCGCESMGSPTARPVQFNADGSVLRGRINNKDVGACQINEYYWLEESIRVGYDIYTEEGNYLMANHILETQGIDAWVWSNACHGALD